MALKKLNLSDVIWSVVAVGIVAVGIIGFNTLGALRAPVAPVPVERKVPLVEAAPLQQHVGPLPISGRGFIRPRQQLALAAVLPGRVVELHPSLLSLGRVDQGEMLVQLDDRIARATLAQTESDIRSIKARLALNATQLERAESLRKRGAVSQEVLDQRLAEREELTSSLSSLNSARDSARISLEAMRIVAPFDAQILSRSVELGSIAGQGQPLAELFTPDALEVTVALEEREAALVPDLFNRGNASASVTVSFAGRQYRWSGTVTRVGPQLSALTRTLDVTITLDDGAGVADDNAHPLSAGTPPALVNAWASVTINGHSNQPLHAIPLHAMREDNTIWLVANNTLHIVAVQRVHQEQNTAYIALDQSGLDFDPSTAQLVTSLLTAPVDGMPVALVSETGKPLTGDAVNEQLTLVLDKAVVQ